MSLFFKPSEKTLLEARHEVFQQRGAPALARNGFVRSPFSTGWFGKNDTGGYSYEFCRVMDTSRLDMILVHINRKDRWVQLRFNAFFLHPKVNEIEQLRGEDGLQFHLPPNSLSQTRIAGSGGRIFAASPEHKLRTFFSQVGMAHRLKQLGDVLERDLSSIDDFVCQWLVEHKSLVTDWKGFPIPSI